MLRPLLQLNVFDHFFKLFLLHKCPGWRKKSGPKFYFFPPLKITVTHKGVDNLACCAEFEELMSRLSKIVHNLDLSSSSPEQQATLATPTPIKKRKGLFEGELKIFNPNFFLGPWHLQKIYFLQRKKMGSNQVSAKAKAVFPQNRWSPPYAIFQRQRTEK